MNLVRLRPSQAINVFPLVPFLYLMLITGMTLSICLVCKIHFHYSFRTDRARITIFKDSWQASCHNQWRLRRLQSQKIVVHERRE